MTYDLAALRTLAKKATPGPWLRVDHNRVVIRPAGESERELVHPVFGDDAAFIAACDPQTVLALVEAVEAAQPVLARLEAEDDPDWDSPSELDRFAAALAPFRQEHP